MGIASIHFSTGAGRSTRIALRVGNTHIEQRNRAVFENGAPVQLPASQGLFAQDQRWASAQILDGTPHYISADRICQVLSLVEELENQTIG